MSTRSLIAMIVIAAVGIVLVLTANLPAEQVWTFVSGALAGAGAREATLSR